MADKNKKPGFETTDIKSSVVYLFFGLIVVSVIMTVFIVLGTFAFLTNFESATKFSSDPILAAMRKKHDEQMRQSLESQYKEVFCSNVEEAKNQASISMTRISVNGFVRPIDPPQPTLEGVDVLSPLHSGGQPNPFTIGQETIRKGNNALKGAGIDKAIAAVIAANSKSKGNGNPPLPSDTNGGRN